MFLGTYPKDVQTALHEFQLRAERNSDRWMRLDLWEELVKVRTLLASYLNADDPDDLVVIPNTTSGMNAIFRSLKYNPGDRILHFSTAYDAMRSVIQYVVDQSGGTLSSLAFTMTHPISNAELIRSFASFLDAYHRPDAPIRIALIDHITSVPGVRIPIEELIPLLKERNILVVIDGAHAIGQVPIDLTSLGVDYYITNCHKWLYAARGAAVMYVKKEHQSSIHPSSIAAAYAPSANFQKEFFWTGTMDFSSYMTIPTAMAFRASIGEETLRNYTHQLAVEGGALVARVLGTVVLQTEDQIGNMVDVELPIHEPNDPQLDRAFWDDTLLNRFNIYVAPHIHNERFWIRLSAQIYNDLADFEKAAQVFTVICEEINQKKR